MTIFRLDTGMRQYDDESRENDEENTNPNPSEAAHIQIIRVVL